MIAVICAMDVELEEVKKLTTQIEIKTIGTRDFYVGNINEKDVVLVKSGIGKVNAAITTTLLLEHFDIEYVICCGVAGGVKANLDTVVFANKVMYHDVHCANFGYDEGQIPGENKYFFAASYLLEEVTEIASKLNLEYSVGLIATGDVFVTDEKQLAPLIHIENIEAIDMEAAAIAQVATQYFKSFVIVRTISDKIGDNSQTSVYRGNVMNASAKASLIIGELIK